MPKLYQSQKPYSGFVQGQASAEDFGSGIGAGLGELGKAMQIKEHNAEVAKATELFGEFERQDAKNAQQEALDASENAEGFSDSRIASADNLASSFRGQLSAKGQKLFDRFYDDHKTKTYKAALGFEVEKSSEYNTTVISQRQSAENEQVMNDPAYFGTAMNRMNDLIDSMAFKDEEDRELAKKKAADEMAYNYGTSIMRPRDGEDISGALERTVNLRNVLLNGGLDHLLSDDSKEKLLRLSEMNEGSLSSGNKTLATEYYRNGMDMMQNKSFSPDEVNSMMGEFHKSMVIMADGDQAVYDDLAKQLQIRINANNMLYGTKFGSPLSWSDAREAARLKTEDSSEAGVLAYNENKKTLDEIISRQTEWEKERRSDPMKYNMDNPLMRDAWDTFMLAIENDDPDVAETAAMDYVERIKSIQRYQGNLDSELKILPVDKANEIADEIMSADPQTASDRIVEMEQFWGEAWPDVRNEIPGMGWFADTIVAMGSNDRGRAYLLHSMKNLGSIEEFKKNELGVNKETFNTQMQTELQDYQKVFGGQSKYFNSLEKGVEAMALQHWDETGRGSIADAVKWATSHVFSNYHLSNRDYGGIQADLLIPRKYDQDAMEQSIGVLAEVVASGGAAVSEVLKDVGGQTKRGFRSKFEDVETAVLPKSLHGFDLPQGADGISDEQLQGFMYDAIKGTGKFVPTNNGIVLRYYAQGIPEYLTKDGEIVKFSWDDIKFLGDNNITMRSDWDKSGSWKRLKDTAVRAARNAAELSKYTSAGGLIGTALGEDASNPYLPQDAK